MKRSSISSRTITTGDNVLKQISVHVDDDVMVEEREEEMSQIRVVVGPSEQKLPRSTANLCLEHQHSRLDELTS